MFIDIELLGELKGYIFIAIRKTFMSVVYFRFRIYSEEVLDIVGIYYYLYLYYLCKIYINTKILTK